MDMSNNTLQHQYSEAVSPETIAEQERGGDNINDVFSSAVITPGLTYVSYGFNKKVVKLEDHRKPARAPVPAADAA